MDGLMLIAALLMAGAGIFFAIKPRAYYDMEMALRSRDPGEPTRLYLTVIRVVGILFALMGVGIAAVLLIAPSLPS